MSSSSIHALITIIIAGMISLICRATPFLLFSGGRNMPKWLKRITDSLPPAIIAVLVIYCLKDAITKVGYNTLSTLLAVVSVILVHLWKRNTLLSILAGTIVYMLLIRVFP